MLKKTLLATAVATIIFSGCSSKQYYEPANAFSLSTLNMGDKIIHYSRDGATLESGKVLTKNQMVDLQLPQGFYFINNSANAAITADLHGNCNIVTKNGIANSIKFPEALVAGTLVDKYLIYLLQNNHYGVYDLSQKKVIYDNKSNKAFAIDTRIANPLLVDKLVVIPTLDGKLTVLDLSTMKVVKEMYVSTEPTLNNIIFLGKLNNTLIAATPYRLLSISSRGKKELDTAISEVLTDNHSIFVFAKDGRILKLNEALSIEAEKKFKFAHFSVAALTQDKVFALDKQGYLIVANKNLSKHKVYKVSEVDSYAFVSQGKLYLDDEIIDLNQLTYE
jgi:outer membrane protein assembly factor BamB